MGELGMAAGDIELKTLFPPLDFASNPSKSPPTAVVL